MFSGAHHRNVLGGLMAVVFLFLFALAIQAHDGLHEQIVAVTKKILTDPKNPELYLKRAELYRLHREWRNSENDFRRAERLNPNLAVVDLGRGKLWLDAGQHNKAKQALEIFLSKEPDSYEGVITIARVFAKLMQTDNAVRFFTKAISMAPEDSSEIYLERARTLASENKIDEALHGLDEGIAKIGGLVTLQTAAIDMEVRRKHYDAAIYRLDRLSAPMPRKESFLLRRGEILVQAGRLCDARVSLTEAQARFNARPPAQRNVRAVREQYGRLQRLLNETQTKNCG